MNFFPSWVLASPRIQQEWLHGVTCISDEVKHPLVLSESIRLDTRHGTWPFPCVIYFAQNIILSPQIFALPCCLANSSSGELTSAMPPGFSLTSAGHPSLLSTQLLTILLSHSPSSAGLTPGPLVQPPLDSMWVGNIAVLRAVVLSPGTSPEPPPSQAVIDLCGMNEWVI